MCAQTHTSQVTRVVCIQTDAEHLSQVSHCKLSDKKPNILQEGAFKDASVHWRKGAMIVQREKLIHSVSPRVTHFILTL